MGVIIRQGAKSSLISYVATFLGVINTILIYPLTLDVNQLGEIQFVIQTATLFVPFLVLGFTNVSSKFFSKYVNEESGTSGFFTFLLIPIFFSSVAVVCIYFGFKETIISFYKERSGVSPLAIKSLFIVMGLMSFISILNSFSSNLKRIAIPSVFNNLIKVTLPLLCLAYYFDYLEFKSLFYGIIAHFLVVLLLFLVYLRKIGRIGLSFSLIKNIGKLELFGMGKFALFGVLAGLGSQIATRIDALMVTSIKSTYDNGIYTIASFMSNTIAIPLSLIGAISTPIIASYWLNKESSKIDAIYKKSSLNLFVLGLGLFLVLWAALDGIFEVMPKGGEFEAGKNVILILSFAKLVDMISGLNSQILSMSEKYLVFFYFLLFLSFTNVILNIVLIPRVGIVGAAYSTLFSIFFFNLFKFLYLQIRFNLNPFSIETVKVLVLGAVLFSLLTFTQEMGGVLQRLFVLPSITAVVYIIVILKLGVSPDLNRIYENIKSRVIKS